MRRMLWVVAAMGLLVTPMGCGSGDEPQEMPPLMKQRFQTEMKVILHDLRLAQEEAYSLEGQYVEFEALEGEFFTRPVPEAYELTLKDVTLDGYRAEVVHKPSGLRCELLMTETSQPGSGIPRCD
jgi:hypothetical protein